MKVVFGDSLYFLALVNPRDTYHERAVGFAREWRGVIVTTRWILAEVCDGLSSAVNRSLAVALTRQVTTSRRFRLVLGSDELFERGFALYRRRLIRIGRSPIASRSSSWRTKGSRTP